MCGSTEIDGSAFCLGLDLFGTDLTYSMNPVSLLIRGAIFRPRRVLRKQGRVSLGMCSLGELVDMYHTHEATKPHDTIYALLGMCSDDISGAGLQPNYSIQWKILMQNLVKFILGDQASVATSNDKVAFIKIKGSVLGKVSSVESSTNIGGGRNVEFIFENTSKESGCLGNGRARWTLRTSAKSIQNGDLLCLFQGAPKPTIIRLHKDHFDIIILTVIPLKHTRTENRNNDWPGLSQSASFTRDFLLVWNWEHSSRDERKCDAWMWTSNCRSGHSEKGLERQLENATRTWNVALILGDLGEYEKARERLREAIQGYEIALGYEPRHIPEIQIGLTPLLWAAGNGKDTAINLLLTKYNVDIDLKDCEDDRTALSWAAKNGHEAIFLLLLDTGKVDVDSKDKYSRTPLSWAAENGYETMVKLLLTTGKVEVDSKDNCGRSPLSLAAGERARDCGRATACNW
jgi:hypothetical protein